MSRRRLSVSDEPFLLARCLAVNYGPGFVIKTHCHEWHQLLYATTGCMTVTCPATTWIVPPGRAVWIPANAEHGIRMWGTVAMRSMYFRPDQGVAAAPACKVVAVSPLLRELVLRSVDLAGLDSREASEQQIAALVLHEVARAEDGPLQLPLPRDERARRVVDAVLSDPSRKSAVEEIAREAGLSQRTLERVFSGDTGMSFGMWRQKARLLASLRVLAETGSVTDAALDSGYASISAYIAAFRQTFGCTPGSLTG